jgi:hypothetical protein
MKKLHIAVSPLSNRIYAGHVQKPGEWAAGKQDLTTEALLAVAEHALNFGEPVILSENGKEVYRITVKNLKG